MGESIKTRCKAWLTLLPTVYIKRSELYNVPLSWREKIYIAQGIALPTNCNIYCLIIQYRLAVPELALFYENQDEGCTSGLSSSISSGTSLLYKEHIP